MRKNYSADHMKEETIMRVTNELRNLGHKLVDIGCFDPEGWKLMLETMMRLIMICGDYQEYFLTKDMMQ